MQYIHNTRHNANTICVRFQKKALTGRILAYTVSVSLPKPSITDSSKMGAKKQCQNGACPTPRIPCAWKGCRSKLDAKNMPLRLSLPYASVDLRKCRATLRPDCKRVRFCCEAHMVSRSDAVASFFLDTLRQEMVCLVNQPSKRSQTPPKLVNQPSKRTQTLPKFWLCAWVCICVFCCVLGCACVAFSFFDSTFLRLIARKVPKLGLAVEQENLWMT